MTTPYIVRGVVGHGISSRKEIYDFVQDEKQFSLYVQALRSMYEDSEDNLLSFFQVSGIHGWPYIPWNNATPDDPHSLNIKRQQQWGGYCVHGSVLFPTWHRTYLVLLEQIINERAQIIADTYQVDTEAWKKAASTLRQPYWDWAKHAVPPPEVIELSVILIITPDGKRTSINNPLLYYTFQEQTAAFPRKFAKWRTTVRQPTKRSSDIDQIKRLKIILENNHEIVKTKVYYMLTRLKTWSAFSNHSVEERTAVSNSLESIHDNIHVFIGGHMSNPAVAGFDPIFYLHHCNVDRLLSIWSALNPGVWVTAGKANRGSFTIPTTTLVDGRTALTPFRKDCLNYWPSVDMQDTRLLGYTYPELACKDVSNDYGSILLVKVTELYGGCGFGLPTVKSLLGFASLSTNFYLDWTVQVTFRKFELGDSFSVFLFLGPIPPLTSTSGTMEWWTSANIVGTVDAFSNSELLQCANCRRLAEGEIVQEGFVHLNEGIRKLFSLGGGNGNAVYNAADVTAWLEKNINWQVRMVDGAPAHLTTLEVTVLSTPMYLSTDQILTPGESRRHSNITYGRPGGCRVR